MMWMQAVVALGTAAVAAALVEQTRRLALKRGILDVPNDRSSHKTPTPRGGGVVIVLFTLTGWGLSHLQTPSIGNALFWTAWAGAAMIALVSWVDDLRSLSTATRFLAHAVAAALVVFACWMSLIAISSAVAPWVPAVALAALAFLWIAGLTNAYNFMDGIDGIAGTQALVAGIGWYALGNTLATPEIQWSGLILAASSVGFLAHNRPPARIFMGDVGSAFIGFFLGVTTLIAATVAPWAALAGALLVWPFVIDATLTFFRRLLRRENVFKAHRSHLYQRLVAAGWSHGCVTLLYGALALTGLGAALALSHSTEAGTAASVMVALAALGLWLLVVIQEQQAR